MTDSYSVATWSLASRQSLRSLFTLKKMINKRDRETTRNTTMYFPGALADRIPSVDCYLRRNVYLGVFDCLLGNVAFQLAFLFQCKYHRNLNEVFHSLIHVCMLSWFSFNVIFKCDFYAYFAIM